jgi:predicted RNA polymerase sigma factor
MVTLNRIVAVAMVDGPEAGLRAVAGAEAEPALAGHHRIEAVRAHLLEEADRGAEAEAAYRRAARLTTSLPERRYLEDRAARVAGRR